MCLILSALFIYMAFRELHEDPLWSLIYALIGLEYGLDLYGLAKPKKAAH